MVILVAGGAGFAGSNFINYILNKYTDYKVICVDRKCNTKTLLKTVNNHFFKSVELDICNQSELYRVFEEENPDIVVNFTEERISNESSTIIQTNITGTNMLLDACKKYGIMHFHQVSSGEVYGNVSVDEHSLLFTEASPVNPCSRYSSAKTEADFIVRSYYESYNLPITISRCSNNYGGYQTPDQMLSSMIISAFTNKPLSLHYNGYNVLDWLYVEDHCKAIDLIIFHGREGEIYNVCGNNEINAIDLARHICFTLGKPESLITFVSSNKETAIRLAISSAKIQDELGWKPETDLSEGVNKTIDWYFNNRDWWEEMIPNNTI